jgi:acetyl esterase
MTVPPPLASLLDASHRWALERAREAIHAGLSGHDRSLPELAERRELQAPGAEGPLEARLYRPAGVAEDAPLLLYFHGGGFVVSDLDTHEALCIRLAHAGGLRVLASRYRLAPEHRFPAQLDDAGSVARWLLGEAALARGARIAIGGDSAGAYLAAASAAQIEPDHPGAFAAQLLLYPLVQMDEAVWAETLLQETRAVGWAAVRYIDAQLGGSGAPSLLSLPLAPSPSLIVAGGPLDPCRADALALAENLRAAGREVVWREYPPLIHGFGNLTHVSAAARQALAEIGAALGEMLAR